MASKSWAPPAIEAMAHKDEKIIYLYIDVWIGKQKLRKTLVDLGIVIELINQKVVYDPDLCIHRIDKK